MPAATVPLKIAVVTGSRADFGLLEPVIDAIDAHPGLEPLVIAAGAHLIQPALTFRDVKKRFAVADSVPMQTVGRTGRWHDAQALGKGVSRFARSFELLDPDCALVLGDRIEAFAAAAAASIGGVPVAHIHGGDRAEGVADEAMRHAITKLAHIHFPATRLSRERILKMGERPEHVFNVGSPALDGLESVEPMTDDECDGLFGDGFRPDRAVLHHPCGMSEQMETYYFLEILEQASLGGHTVFLKPNHDPGREIIERMMVSFVEAADANEIARFTVNGADVPFEYSSFGSGVRATIVEHLPRAQFLRLLKRLRGDEGMIGLVGNSSAALIEAPALGVLSFNYGPRQAGREKPATVMTVAEDPSVFDEEDPPTFMMLQSDAMEGLGDDDAGGDAGPDYKQRLKILERKGHPYRSNKGPASTQIAKILAEPGLISPKLLRKRNTY